MGEMAKLNINDIVRVRLSQRGRLILRMEHDALTKKHPRLGKYKPPQTDAEGFTEFQLWDLMRTFGPHMNMADEVLFDTTILVPLPALND